MVIRMSPEVAAQVEDRFDNLAQDFFNLSDLVVTARHQLDGACGDFSSDMQGYTQTFESGWSQTFDIASECAGLIAGNTNQVMVDLQKVDRDASHQTAITI
ncbi:hypothetical protein [Nocardioides bizhenqiangii]|uniref:WXG100 family type VII secretion target n=1 Tax=Nocardioides bizhenqiangii TaxID=3095076 RepID=A0ABZ0ZSY0_9ACTN|nr:MULTISPECIES: hypothetical protein [unclassified Nocardioides]MDZ5619214.1 hypothetical protein [Nocardioides sp. HM23]WQQ26762.1 hypothetical protein SHK19_00680 [Nocardioides sp. HM61]